MKFINYQIYCQSISYNIMSLKQLFLIIVCLSCAFCANFEIKNSSQHIAKEEKFFGIDDYFTQKERQYLANKIVTFIKKLILEDQKTTQQIIKSIQTQYFYILSQNNSKKQLNPSLLPKNTRYHLQKIKKQVQSISESKFINSVQQQFQGLYELLKKQLFIDVEKLKKEIQKIITQFKLKKIDEWQLVAHPFLQRQYFGITVSNGVIGAVSSREPYKVGKTVLAGNYQKFGRGNVDNLVQTFPILNFRVSCVGNDVNFKQTLNMKEAKMTGSLSNNDCQVKYTYYALKNLPFGFYTSIQVQGKKNMSVTIQNIHEAPAYMTTFKKNYEKIVDYNMLISEGKTPSGLNDMVMVSAMKLIVNSNEKDNSSYIHGNYDSNNHYENMQFQIKANQTKKIFIMSSIMTNQFNSDPINEAIRVVILGVTQSQTQLLNKHISLWAELWKSDIQIVGNLQDQQNARNMLYHFYSFINPVLNYGLSPMGLSGLGYNGHVFWDMDLWMYPSFLVLHPQLARSLIQYRINRLQSAKDNAFINGYRGAMFPWQSSKTGQEQCPVWALSGPLQHHISGCVSFAVWNYYRVTRDIDWLKNKGYKVIKAVADFWMSRVVADQQGNFHIRNVVGADEYAQNVDDNAFTNAIAIKSLQIVEKASTILKLQIDPKWELVRQKIVILKFKDINVTQQHSTYHGETVKQADVNLLAYPLDTVKDYDAIQRDLKYYESKIPTKNVPAMTKAIFSILYNRLGNITQAYDNFLKSHRSNMRPPFNVLAETVGGDNPYFLTGAGGALQALIFGFAGFSITDKGLVIDQKSIPKQWKDIKITGQSLDKYVKQITNKQKNQHKAKLNWVQTDTQHFQIEKIEQKQ